MTTRSVLSRYSLTVSLAISPSRPLAATRMFLTVLFCPILSPHNVGRLLSASSSVHLIICDVRYWISNCWQASSSSKISSACLPCATMPTFACPFASIIPLVSPTRSYLRTSPRGQRRTLFSASPSRRSTKPCVRFVCDTSRASRDSRRSSFDVFRRAVSRLFFFVVARLREFAISAQSCLFHVLVMEKCCSAQLLWPEPPFARARLAYRDWETK